MIDQETQQLIDDLDTRLGVLEDKQRNKITPLLGTRTFGFGGSLSSLSTGSATPNLVFVDGILTSSKIV